MIVPVMVTMVLEPRPSLNMDRLVVVTVMDKPNTHELINLTEVIQKVTADSSSRVLADISPRFAVRNELLTVVVSLKL